MEGDVEVASTTLMLESVVSDTSLVHLLVNILDRTFLVHWAYLHGGDEGVFLKP